MTYEKFKESWDRLVSAKAPAEGRLVDEGIDEHFQDMLIAASNGDFSRFTKMEKEFALFDKLTSP